MHLTLNAIRVGAALGELRGAEVHECLLGFPHIHGTELGGVPEVQIGLLDKAGFRGQPLQSGLGGLPTMLPAD